MACGAINALYVKDNQEYWKVIQSKIDDIWEFQPY